MDLIKEAIKRGYKEGTVINYGFKDDETLGSGEFEIKHNGDLIKYEHPKPKRKFGENDAYDTIHDFSGWTKIV